MIAYLRSEWASVLGAIYFLECHLPEMLGIHQLQEQPAVQLSLFFSNPSKLCQHASFMFFELGGVVSPEDCAPETNHWDFGACKERSCCPYVSSVWSDVYCWAFRRRRRALKTWYKVRIKIIQRERDSVTVHWPSCDLCRKASHNEQATTVVLKKNRPMYCFHYKPLNKMFERS
jgi:hypothetical protein